MIYAKPDPGINHRPVNNFQWRQDQWRIGDPGHDPAKNLHGTGSPGEPCELKISPDTVTVNTTLSTNSAPLLPIKEGIFIDTVVS